MHLHDLVGVGDLVLDDRERGVRGVEGRVRRGVRGRNHLHKTRFKLPGSDSAF